MDSDVEGWGEDVGTLVIVSVWIGFLTSFMLKLRSCGSDQLTEMYVFHGP